MIYCKVSELTLEILSRFDIKMGISSESLEHLQKIDDYLKHGSIIIYAESDRDRLGYYPVDEESFKSYEQEILGGVLSTNDR